MRAIVLAILVGLSCAGASAQDRIYKVRMPDGRILFTDRPPPGGVIVSEREAPPPSTPAAQPAAPRAPDGDAPPGSIQERASQAEMRLRERSAEIERAFAAVQDAERELEAAQQRLQEGRAPAEGEMLATARGRVRPSPAIQARVTELEKAVAAAEEKLAKARDDLNAVR